MDIEILCSTFASQVVPTLLYTFSSIGRLLGSVNLATVSHIGQATAATDVTNRLHPLTSEDCQ